ncbi:MAG: DEAD/DEAH box helicase family protein [Flavobacteriales bacterium]|nr:DEAD/DEAH box helicase family protein [Flavobacteriales bacterium]
MTLEPLELLEKKQGKTLYDYQIDSIEQIFDRIRKFPSRYNLLFQLPTGGGKTVIFSEISRRYILESQKSVLILTHRIELCGQTSRMLDEIGVPNKIINSKVKEIEEETNHKCFVAMVETLNNRLNDEKMELADVGLVIVDEAHYNSFRKLFKFFEDCIILGVTATPLSSNIKLPLKDNYNELIVGESISALIEKGFLAKAQTYSYDVQLRSLKVGINGDYTVSSSERLYGNYFMQEKLLYAYEEKCKGQKTLIFNNGIATSRQVHELFKDAGYEIRHLDNTNTEQERKDILEWFKNKPDAILTSVSILTTGFDEPTVETIILNRATKSLTLYHQMIGRGSRILPKKANFNVIDLGNNARRFGLWESYINWQDIFRSPNSYLESLASDEEIEEQFTYEMPSDLRKKFGKSKDISFDMKEEYLQVLRDGHKPKQAIVNSIDQHARMLAENSEDVFDALELSEELNPDIEYRVKLYTRCISKNTENFVNWLSADYKRQLKQRVRELF